MIKGQRLVLVALLLVAGATFGLREHVLRMAGGLLVAEDRIEPADMIVVPEWAGDAGALEAVDLVRRGIADRVTVLVAPSDPAQLELVRRGIRRADDPSPVTRLLRSMAVNAIEELEAEGTEGESDVLAEWSERRRYRTIVVISASDHSRRVRRSLRRSMKGHSVRTLLRVTRYSQFDPARWWQTHAGIRTGLEELGKLLVDVARHPL